LSRIAPILRPEFGRLAAKYHRADAAGALGDFPFFLIPNQAKTTDRRYDGGNRKFATKKLGYNVGVRDVVKNSLPEKVLLKSAWISVERRFALCRPIEMMPGLGRHLPARDGPQIPQAQLL
jgi:hypothetical protein